MMKIDLKKSWWDVGIDVQMDGWDFWFLCELSEDESELTITEKSSDF